MKSSLAGGIRNKIGGLHTEHHNNPVSISIIIVNVFTNNLNPGLLFVTCRKHRE